ncbi:MAG: hypothetical protein ABSF90_30115 [Syntrophobacteraceae bacterium]
MAYDIFIHRHNFAVWAASRAVHRNWNGAKTRVLVKAIEDCGVKDFLQLYKEHSISYDEFEHYHHVWCCKIQESTAASATEASYGRAAKLLAVYLKAMVIVAGAENTKLAHLIYPPIDSILLKNIGDRFNRFKKLKDVKWTQSNESEYYSLMSLLRECLSKEQPLWMLEEYWHP